LVGLFPNALLDCQERTLNELVLQKKKEKEREEKKKGFSYGDPLVVNG